MKKTRAPRPKADNHTRHFTLAQPRLRAAAVAWGKQKIGFISVPTARAVPRFGISIVTATGDGMMHQSVGRVVIAIALAVGVAGASPAKAENAMQACGAKYRAAKTAGTVPAGQTWNQFLAACRAALPKDAAADTPPSEKMTIAKPPVGPASGQAAHQLSAAQTAERSRIKQCAAQWQADKAVNKVPAGQTWPRYWSACSARLKG